MNTLQDLRMSDFPEETHGYVYALLASDEPLTFYYIGRTKLNPFYRLKGHLTARRPRPVVEWIASVKQRGSEVRMRILGHYPIAELDHAERRWIFFWSKYCPLINAVFNRNWKPQRPRWSLVNARKPLISLPQTSMRDFHAPITNTVVANQIRV